MRRHIVIWNRVKTPWARLTSSEQNAVMLITALLVLGLVVKAWHLFL
jgi:hypothetical protein